MVIWIWTQRHKNPLPFAAVGEHGIGLKRTPPLPKEKNPSLPPTPPRSVSLQVGMGKPPSRCDRSRLPCFRECARCAQGWVATAGAVSEGAKLTPRRGIATKAQSQPERQVPTRPRRQSQHMVPHNSFKYATAPAALSA